MTFTINLYISDEEEHVSRRRSRSEERDYNEDISKTKMIISQSRFEKNELLHKETMELHQQFNNVFSLDVTDFSPNCVAGKIMELIFGYFNN